MQDFSDLDSLPYLTALCKEILRWQPVVPLGKIEFLRLSRSADTFQAVVHTSVAEDEYRGYHLPKGTFFFGNSWYVLRKNYNIILIYH
jgi:hypothetical protein